MSLQIKVEMYLYHKNLCLQLQEHLDKECPAVELKCPFYIVGCTFEVCE